MGVDDIPRRLDRRARDRVEFAKRPAAAARRPGSRIDPAQLGHELRKIPGRLVLIIDELIRIRPAVDPPVDRPGEGVPALRVTAGDWLGDPQRQVRSQLRQPVPLPLQVPCPRPHPRQPRAEVVAKPVNGVHRPGRRSRADRQGGQPGELRGHQPPDQPGVDLDFPVMHFHPGSPTPLERRN